MRIVTSAPTRIDLAGGTIDIWPLYLFHPGAQTLNAAISIRASARVDSRDDARIVIRSEDTGASLEAEDWRELWDRKELRLLSFLVHFFEARVPIYWFQCRQCRRLSYVHPAGLRKGSQYTEAVRLVVAVRHALGFQVRRTQQFFASFNVGGAWVKKCAE